MSETPPVLIDVPEAQRILFAHVHPGPVVRVRMMDALDRTLAKPVVCDVDYPPFDRSLMDGYAVRSIDVAAVPRQLRVVGQVQAGSEPSSCLVAGEAMQINTGAPIPAGADAVVRLEDTQPAGSRDVVVRAPAAPGQFITPRRSYVRAGQQVLPAGTRMGPLEIAVAASSGAAELAVYRRPRVAIISTGNELVPFDQVPSGAQIRNSNGPLLEALVHDARAEAMSLGVARDTPEDLAARLSEAVEADVICVTGGVSVGQFDFVPEALAGLGATVHIRKMMIKPGRPIQFATLKSGTLVFALPGNPISAFVGFELLVRPALSALEGRSGIVPRELTARLAGVMKRTENRRSYWPARAEVTADGDWTAQPLSWQGSGDPFGMAGANALIVRPPNAEAVSPGDRVRIMLLGRP